MRGMTTVVWEPSQLAYRAEAVIAHKRTVQWACQWSRNRDLGREKAIDFSSATHRSYCLKSSISSLGNRLLGKRLALFLTTFYRV
jgi:hypothetical protein